MVIYMSEIGIAVLVCIFCIIFIWSKVRRYPIMMMDAYLQQNNFTEVLNILEKPSAKKLMKPFEYDRVKLKMSFRAGKKELFLNTIKEIGSKKYKDGDGVELLEKWFHLCLAHRDEELAVEFARSFLEAIRINGSEDVIMLSQLSYAILVEEKSEGEEFLRSYTLRSRGTNFRCGLSSYLLGKLYELQFDIKGAVRSYDSALTQFDCINSTVYYKECKDYIDAYGNENFIHFGEMKTDFIKPVDLVETYRYDPKIKWKKKTQEK